MKKGFTLVELIAVIVILATVSMIVFPNINQIIYSSRQTLHDNQILDINKATEKWATDNSDLLDKYHLNIIYMSLSDIQSTGYLEKENIKDPLNKEIMDGCVQIKYNTSGEKYEYNYQEKSCEDYATSEDDGNLGYIIYEYDAKEKQLFESSTSKKNTPTGIDIYNYYASNNMIYADGDTRDGLYELDDKYVFRGNNVNNYVEFANKTWRILDINKKDYTMHLINTTGISNQFDQEGKIEFQNASSNVDILKKQSLNNSKILSTDFNTDIIDGSDFSRRALASILGKSVTNLEIGLISILDYVNASATLECVNNYLSNACKDNNYLYTMFANNNGSTWTLNSNGNQVWYIDIDGFLKTEDATNIKYLYPVIYVNSNTYITNIDVAVGSISSPYKIK